MLDTFALPSNSADFPNRSLADDNRFGISLFCLVLGFKPQPQARELVIGLDKLLHGFGLAKSLDSPVHLPFLCCGCGCVSLSLYITTIVHNHSSENKPAHTVRVSHTNISNIPMAYYCCEFNGKNSVSGRRKVSSRKA